MQIVQVQKVKSLWNEMFPILKVFCFHILTYPFSAKEDVIDKQCGHK